MRILVTGAGGMLGHDVLAATGRLGHEAVGLTRAELDIADADAVREAVAGTSPQAVVNCAAWTDVDGAEAEPDAAAAVNAAGAGHVAGHAHRAGAWTLHVSSDYVFDGAKREPYVESDATGPLSAYGRSKLAGEQAVAAAAPERHTIVRTSWLFGVHGRCFPKTIQRLGDERDILHIVADQVGCPTFTGHLATVLVALAARPQLGVRHVAAAGQCSWCEFARAIVAASELDCRVDPITTDQYPLPAPRPAFSVLRSERQAPTLPSWRAGLTAFMTQVQRAAA
ncbi:MAG: dTDP-4-dehydrorhamnose reductase [Solirubrobacterales bacterium]|nr:dTDP-4-dehydrorhamnose reductase [Solirubrobacterales bacterium]